MKRYLILAIVALFMVSGFNMAYATGRKCPPGQEKKGWKCVDVEQPGGDGGVVIGDTTNSNSNRNTNLNTNINSNMQGQAQFQGQDQSQSASANAKADADAEAWANNEGVTNTVSIEGDTIKYEAQPNHIAPVSGPDTDTQTVESYAHQAFTIGSVIDLVDGLDLDGIKMLAKDAGDVEILSAVFYEPENSVNYVRIGDDGKFAGFLYASCDDEKCSAAGMEGKALLKASVLGYTSIERIHQSSGEKLYASEWSMKIGGGASIAASGGKMMIAPGGGIGGGAAESSTVLLPAMVFKVYYNPLFINVK